MVEIRSEQFENWYFSRGSITPELMAFFLFLKKKKILIFIICLELSIYRLDCTDADLGLLGPDLWKLFKILFICVSTKIGEPSFCFHTFGIRCPLDDLKVRKQRQEFGQNANPQDWVKFWLCTWCSLHIRVRQYLGFEYQPIFKKCWT